MPVKYAQGDIFEVGPKEEYEFLLVFGHIGLGEMGHAWKEFKKRYANLKDVSDPFSHGGSPISYFERRWVQFVPEEQNHGMSNEGLSQTINAAFGWAVEQGLRSVITNGIKDTDHGLITKNNRTSDDLRVRYLNELVSRYERNFDSIKLISLNDAFTRNIPTNPND